NNESSEIIRMLNSEFKGIAGDDTDYYPLPLRGEIDRINEFVYTRVNNGVYRCGFARSQQAYDAAYDALFAALDELESRLGRSRFLVGDKATEADWRLFPTLVRFDVAYFSIFRCNRQRIADYPNLSRYLRELYRVPGIAATVKPRYYVIGYWSVKKVNPSGIIPKGAAAPDGYTLLVYSSGFVINPYVHKSLPYDTEKDFVPVTNLVTNGGLFFAVANSVPVKSMQEFLEYAKKPGVHLAYSTPGVGNTWHL